MRHFLVFIITGFLLISCKSDPKKDDSTPVETKELTVAEKIAEAHGFDQWDKVSKIDFVFNVDRGDTHFERSWRWEPKKNDITMMSKTDTVRYNRMKMDSTILKTDGGFINDKFWLLTHFNLVWDEGIEISEPKKEASPIGKEELNMISLTYVGDGGYTPGDAYDLYYGDDFLIKEWVFRKANADEPSLITTYEGYQDFNGLKIATERYNEDKSAKFYFTGIKVTTE